MNDYLIATASTCDIDAGWLNEHNIPFISYSFIIDDVPYEDDCKEETKQFVYKKMREENLSVLQQFLYLLMKNSLEVCLKQVKILFLQICHVLFPALSKIVKEQLWK